MPNNFFSSDWHLGHKNILRYDPRPFEDIETHDETIISNYNSIVGSNDNFYFLGDFCLDSRRTEEYLKRLNGKLFFIKGNHDKRNTVKLYEKYGTYLGQLDDLSIKNQAIVLCHYRMDVWNRSHYGSWNLHGHSHGTLKENNKLTLDLGVNTHSYKPLEFEEIRSIMNAKPISKHISGSR